MPENQNAPVVIVVASLEQGRAAVDAAVAAGGRVVLSSPPGASAYGGVQWFARLAATIAAERPDAVAGWIIDCGDRAGDALEALIAGCPAAAFTGGDAAAARLAAVAQSRGAALLRGRADEAVSALFQCGDAGDPTTAFGGRTAGNGDFSV